MPDHPHDEEPNKIDAREARGARRGLPVLLVLAAALFLLMVFWLPVAWFGEATEPAPEETIGNGIGAPVTDDDAEVLPE